MKVLVSMRTELSGKVRNWITRTEGVTFKLLGYGDIVMIVKSVSQGQRIESRLQI